jgi:hypothetical protein
MGSHFPPLMPPVTGGGEISKQHRQSGTSHERQRIAPLFHEEYVFSALRAAALFLSREAVAQAVLAASTPNGAEPPDRCG